MDWKNLPDSYWRQKLTPEQYHVTRQHGTERPWSGEYCESHEPGLYVCVCCDRPLFRSGEKFESGTGWPSFTAPVDDEAIAEIEDRSYGMTRTEVRCARCDAHLGHVFPDGPPPTRTRYCINSLSLRKVDES